MKINGKENGYYLISKITDKKFTEYKGDTLRLSESIPMTVDEVLIGNKNNPKERKRITTFRDSNGRINERVFDYSKEPLRHQLYSYEDYVIGENEWVDKTSIKEYSLKRSLIKTYKDLKDLLGTRTANNTVAERTQTRHNFLATDTSNENIPKTLTSIIISPENQYETHEFIQYTPEKIKLKVSVDKHEFKAATDNQAVQNDEFLAIRGYDIDDSKIPLTKHFIKERGLENSGLVINTEYLPETEKEEKLLAFYTSADGSINYNKLYPLKSKNKLVNVASHESEHAWQWFLHARNTGGDTPYTKELYEKFGPITDKKQAQEAKEYTESINNYTSFDVDFEKYKESKIEILANLKGQMSENKYNSDGEALRTMFKHIPPESL